MTALEKYNEEKEDAKTQRKNRILSSAFDLFSAKGIDTIAITDIAKNAEIGVASVYRYYETKEQIAINTAIWAWKKRIEKILPDISNDEFMNKTGFEKINFFCNFFLELFKEDYLFLRFVYFFDSYIFRSKIDKSKFTEYETVIKSVQTQIVSALQNGVDDKTIKCPAESSVVELYFTIMHSLFSLTQKLSLSEDLLSMNEDVAAVKQIELLIKVILESIKA